MKFKDLEKAYTNLIGTYIQQGWTIKHTTHGNYHGDTEQLMFCPLYKDDDYIVISLEKSEIFIDDGTASNRAYRFNNAEKYSLVTRPATEKDLNPSPTYKSILAFYGTWYKPQRHTSPNRTDIDWYCTAPAEVSEILRKRLTRDYFWELIEYSESIAFDSYTASTLVRLAKNYAGFKRLALKDVNNFSKVVKAVKTYREVEYRINTIGGKSITFNIKNGVKSVWFN